MNNIVRRNSAEHFRRAEQPSRAHHPWRLAALLAWLGAAVVLVGRLASAGPAWWTDRGVLNTTVAASDYSLINQGQLKQLATQAYYEMEARLAGGTGPQIQDLIAAWQNPLPARQPDDYATANIGQLKNAARLFFDRLAQVGYTDAPVVAGRTYPWTPTALDDDDFAYATIGQAKQLFSFDLAADTDGDGMPDWWERSHGLNPNDPSDASADPDGDGLTNLQESLAGRDPHTFDADVAGQQLIASPGSVTVYMDPLTTLTRTVTLTNISNATVNYALDNSGAVAPGGINYIWQDSDSIGGPTYIWNDISTTGTLMNTVSGQDDATGVISDIGFSFPFYGTTYSSVWVTSNGYLTVGSQGWSDYHHYSLPSADMPPLLIAPFFNDLIAGNVYFKLEAGKLTIQFDNATRYSDGGSFSFQVVLEPLGTITFYYKTMSGTVNDATIGIQDGSSSPQGVQVAYNQAYVHNNLAVRIGSYIPFVVATPASGSLSPGQRTNIALTYTSSASQGTFSGSIALRNSSGAVGGPSIATTMIVSTDFDGDGLSNKDAIAYGLDPLGGALHPFLMDSDGDGVPDDLDAFPFDATRWQPAVADPNDHTPPVITLSKPVLAP